VTKQGRLWKRFGEKVYFRKRLGKGRLAKLGKRIRIGEKGSTALEMIGKLVEIG
jgi:hypothetical protein